MAFPASVAGNALPSARTPTTAVPLITVTPTEGGVPNPDDDGRQRERYLHPRFRIDSNEANSSHIGHPSKPSGQIDHEQIEFTPEEDGKTRRQILACRGEIVCFELGAPKGTRTPVFAVRGRRPGPLDEGSVTVRPRRRSISAARLEGKRVTISLYRLSRSRPYGPP